MVDRDVALKASSGVLLTAAAAAVGSAPAVADPAMAPPPAPVPLSTWEGFYLGASVGASWLHSVQDDTAAIPGITVFPFDSASTGGSSSTTNGIGWQGGLNLGYNWQSGNFVYGLEADVSWLGHTSASSNGAFTTNYGRLIAYASGTTFRSSKIDALGTFRARFGFDFNGTLPYVTLGVAGADIKNTFAISGISAGFGYSASTSQTKWVPGIVLGSGIEHKLSQNWTVRGEIDWIGFQTNQLANPLPFSVIYGTLSSRGGPVSFSNELIIARIGLNYRF